MNFSRVVEPLPNTPDDCWESAITLLLLLIDLTGKAKLLLNSSRSLPFITRTGSFCQGLVDYIIWLLFSRWEGLNTRKKLYYSIFKVASHHFESDRNFKQSGE